MAIKREVAYGIVQGLSELWKSEEFHEQFHDFTITVGESQFKSHKFLLAACSGFFRELFLTGVDETELNCLNAVNISSQTFEFILETLYTGRNVLTNDNVIDIWRAAHQLRITFLVKECENFVIETISLDNYIEYLNISKLFHSNAVSDSVWSFILKNANSFFQTPYFRELPISDVLMLVTSQELVTDSEDDVIYAILNWVEFQPHQTELNLEDNSTEHVQCLKTCGKKITNKDLEQENETNSDECRLDIEKVTGVETLFKENKSVEHCVNEKNSKYESYNGEKSLEEITNDVPQLMENSVENCHTDETKQKHANIINKNSSTGRTCEAYKEITLTTYERKQHFPLLLSNTKTCLLSPMCLEILISHPLVRGTQNTTNIIIEAMLYQLQNSKRNEFWPTAAIYRKNSNYQQVGVSVRQNGFRFEINAYSFLTKAWLHIPNMFSKNSVQFFAVDKSLYAVGTGIYLSEHLKNKSNYISMFHLQERSWSEIYVSYNMHYMSSFYVVVVDHTIYFLSSKVRKFWKLDHFSRQTVHLADMREGCRMCFAMCYRQSILAFSTTVNADTCEIDCFDTTQNKWTTCIWSNFNGSLEGMVSFRDGQSTYLLMSTGDLWRFVMGPEKTILFEHVIKLWSCRWHIYGAVTFLEELYIFGSTFNEMEKESTWLNSLSGIFHKINYIGCQDQSTIMPCILNRQCFIDDSQVNDNTDKC